MWNDLGYLLDCAESGCDNVVVCRMCQACHRHCLASPNDVPSHRANIDKILAWLSRRGRMLLN
jgi:hypothetical protein